MKPKRPKTPKALPSLFVFSIGGSKQNVKSFWTPVSESVFYALSNGSIAFAFHGSFFNHFLNGGFSPRVNKIFEIGV